jgi:predicted TIM-barrel fold metal-dependent hydrolase
MVPMLTEAGVRGIRLNLISRPVPQLNDPARQRLARELAARNLHHEVQAHQQQGDELEPWLIRWPKAQWS